MKIQDINTTWQNWSDSTCLKRQFQKKDMNSSLIDVLHMLCLYYLNQSSHQVASRRIEYSDLSWNSKNSYDTEQAQTQHILSKDTSSSSNFDSIFKSTSIAFTNLLYESDLYWNIHQASTECMSSSLSWASTF